MEEWLKADPESLDEEGVPEQAEFEFALDFLFQFGWPAQSRAALHWPHVGSTSQDDHSVSVFHCPRHRSFLHISSHRRMLRNDVEAEDRGEEESQRGEEEDDDNEDKEDAAPRDNTEERAEQDSENREQEDE